MIYMTQFLLSLRDSIRKKLHTINGKTFLHTWGFSMTYLAQFLMSLMASILVSGKAALQANSDRHLTASWKESIVEEKYFSKTEAEVWKESEFKLLLWLTLLTCRCRLDLRRLYDSKYYKDQLLNKSKLTNQSTCWVAIELEVTKLYSKSSQVKQNFITFKTEITNISAQNQEYNNQLQFKQKH